MNTTPGRLISIIAVLILLVLAAEGGYYWGYSQGLKNAPAPLAILTQTPPIPTQGPIIGAKDPTDIQTAAGVMALLFKPQVIDHLKNVPADAVWWSSWSIAVGGKLSSLNDKEISLELTPDQGVKNWSLPPLTHYQISNETTRQNDDISKEAIQSGDTINFSVNFDTRTGEILEAWIIKSLK